MPPAQRITASAAKPCAARHSPAAHHATGTVNLEVDAEQWTAMLGYAIGRRWWGQGIATEAARAAMAWGIDACVIARIWAATEVGYVRARRGLEKLGMEREALRSGDHVGLSGELIDEVVYGLNLTR